MSAESVTLTIDGVPVTVAKGTTIIEAAKQVGILVPHYCYHPALPSPALCRMCLVEVEKAPKLMPACVTTVAEGQVVRVHSPDAVKARESVLEFLLINHPLDCPICDQAGECELQNYVFQEGRARSRYLDYPKRFNPVEDFGPDVLYVPNRCILCTRCVRFMSDVALEPVLTVSERGDRAFIGIAESERLDHPWSGNVVDLCPVGSLLSKDFLHKARAWELDKTASICPGCSQGCNVMIETREEVVVRLQPRPNLEVNRHFICDQGRLDYRWMNRGNRLEVPRLGPKSGVRDWEAALDRLAELLGRAHGPVAVLASGRASTEALGWLRRLTDGRPGVAVAQVPIAGEEAPLAGIPNLALRRERAPNGDGARLLGYSLDWESGIAAAQEAELTILLDVTLTEGEVAAIRQSGAVVALATLADEWLEGIELVLPVTTMAEENGTYVNRDLRVQRFMQAKYAPGMSRPAWWVAAAAWARLGPGREVPDGPEAAFSALSEDLPALAGLDYAALGLTGRVLEAEAVESPQ